MAEKACEIIWGVKGSVIAKWTGLQNGDTGLPFEDYRMADKCVQVVGTFGTGGKVAIQGSNMVTTPTWNTMVDPQGNLLEFTVAGLEVILEDPLKIRPSVVAGDAATLLDVYLKASAVTNID